MHDLFSLVVLQYEASDDRETSSSRPVTLSADRFVAYLACREATCSCSAEYHIGPAVALRSRARGARRPERAVFVPGLSQLCPMTELQLGDATEVFMGENPLFENAYAASPYYLAMNQNMHVLKSRAIFMTRPPPLGTLSQCRRSSSL